jgi:hypothetical protein
MRALTPAIRTELPQFHAIRIILLVFRRDIVPVFALRAGERHQNAILFAFGRHASPSSSLLYKVAPPTRHTQICHCMATMRKRSGANHSRLLYTIPQLTV